MESDGMSNPHSYSYRIQHNRNDLGFKHNINDMSIQRNPNDANKPGDDG